MQPAPFYVVVGLGISGLSAARYLASKNIPFAMIDSRDNPPNLSAVQNELKEVPIYLGDFHRAEAVLNKATTIVLSPGVSPHEPLFAACLTRGTALIGDIELFAEAVRVPVIAITGTNAKSTVTTLVGLMAEAVGEKVQVGGNLGMPALQLLQNHPETTLFVLELSSFQLETTHSLKAKVATILNISPDHLDRHGTYENYQQAKQRIYHHADIAVCNRDDSLTTSYYPVHQTVYFTLQTPRPHEFGLIVKDNMNYLAQGDQPLLPVSALPVKGKHYQANALAALAIGRSLGWPMATLLQVLRDFPGLPHRCQFVRELDDVKWYNDSKGTNVGATIAAIQGIGSEITGKLILLAGGVGKNADFSALKPSIEQYCRHVVLFGEAAQAIADAIQGSAPLSFADSLEGAVVRAATMAQPDDSILLSPACASFDMFKDYAHRGEIFMSLVRAL